MMFDTNTMQINHNKQIYNPNFQAIKMSYKPTIQMLDKTSGIYKDKDATLIKIDFSNRQDIVAIQSLISKWQNARYIRYICSLANYGGEDISIYAITNQKNDFKVLDADKILSICAVDSFCKDADIFGEYIQTDPSLLCSELPKYSKTGRELVNGLKEYYNSISIIPRAEEKVIRFMTRNGFKFESPNSSRMIWRKQS